MAWLGGYRKRKAVYDYPHRNRKEQQRRIFNSESIFHLMKKRVRKYNRLIIIITQGIEYSFGHRMCLNKEDFVSRL